MLSLVKRAYAIGTFGDPANLLYGLGKDPLKTGWLYTCWKMSKEKVQRKISKEKAQNLEDTKNWKIKMLKRFEKNSVPSSHVIRAARSNLKYHMQYFNYLIKDHDYFVDDKLSYVDLFYGASLTVLDYIDELNFFEFEKLKNLYSIVKSRPSFKKILADRIIGVNPHSDYLKLDY